jgi:hypothetical protein
MDTIWTSHQIIAQRAVRSIPPVQIRHGGTVNRHWMQSVGVLGLFVAECVVAAIRQPGQTCLMFSPRPNHELHLF